MNKIKSMIIILSVLLVGITMAYGSESSDRQEVKVDYNVEFTEDIEAEAKAIGEAMKVRWNKEKNNKMISSDRQIGTVLGAPVFEGEMDMRRSLYELSDSQNPVQDAWDSIKIQAYEKEFATKHGLLPTENEINAYTQYIRELTESSEIFLQYVSAMLEAAEMTEDEYWNEYKPQIEVPLYLTHLKVSDYVEKNGAETIKATEIEAQISDNALNNQLK